MPKPETADRRPIPQRAGWAMMMAFGLACAVRLGWVVFRYAGDWQSLQYPDEEAYWQVASSLAAGSGLVDEFGYRATYMPAYPAFLAIFAHLSSAPLLWARIVQAVLGALAAPAVYLLARQWICLARPKPSPVLDWLPLAAAVMVALDPFLLFFSGLLLTEALFTVSLLLLWWACLRLLGNGSAGHLAISLFGGAMLLVCLMLRPASAVLLLLAPVAILIGRRWDRRAWGYAAIVVLTSIIGLLPWVVRNQRVIGEFRWLTTRGGISLYDGLQRGATGASDLAHTKHLPEVRGMSEVQWDAYFRQRAWTEAKEQPQRVALLALHKIARTWSLTPNVENYRRGGAAIVGGVWTAAVYGFALVGIFVFRRSIRALTLLLLPVVGFTLLHAVFVGSVRYRLPWMPLLEVLAVAGALVLIGRLRDNNPCSCRIVKCENLE